MLPPSLIHFSHYIPLLTTVVSAVFAAVILGRWRRKPEALHLLWWGLGVITYGAGTLLESLHTLLGWQEVIFKSWYIAGALLGGAPLAIGTIYLLFSRRAGHLAVGLLLTAVTVTSVFVILSPVNSGLVEPGAALSGKVLGWQQVRLVSPFINSLAFVFLVGGAIYSAVLARRRPEGRNRFIGNVYIAIGAVLPGIGGSFSRLGYTEVLYVAELVGLLLIWTGYKYCQRPLPARQVERAPERVAVSSDSRSVPANE